MTASCGISEQQALLYWLMNPCGPYPPDVDEILTDLFGRIDASDTVESRIEELVAATCRVASRQCLRRESAA